MNAPTETFAAGIGLQLLSIAEIQPSDSPIQIARRKRYSKEGLDELAVSVKAMGVLQPILVRPTPGYQIAKADGIVVRRYQIIAGERRWRAAKLAGAEVVPAFVTNLDDKAALEVQLTENLQREGLHEMEEAEGYELLVREHGYTRDAIAAKIGKSLSYVHARMKLADLVTKVRELFYAGELDASRALLVARLPAYQQAEAAEVIGEQAMSYRAAQDWIHRTFLLRLKEAPFDPKDATLVASAGSCAACPKRTGSQPELWQDVKGADICTDARCFDEKRDAHHARKREALEQAGLEVISGEAAKKLKPYRHSDIGGGFIDLDAEQYVGGKHTTMRKLLGKQTPEAVTKLEDPHTGAILDIVKKSEIVDLVPDNARYIVGGSGGARSEDQRKVEDKRKTETALRLRIVEALRAQPQQIDLEDMRMIARAFFAAHTQDHRRALFQLYGWQPKKSPNHGGQDYDVPFIANLGNMDLGQCARLLLDLALAGYMVAYSHDGSTPKALLEVAERRGVDVAALRKEVSAAKKAKAKKKPAPKRKAKAAQQEAAE